MTHEGARARRRRIAAEVEAATEQAWREYEQTPEGQHQCRWIRVPLEPPKRKT